MRWREWLGVGERRWKKAPDEEVQPAKTLWDWLQLLIVPAILIGVTFAWSATQTSNDNKREDRRIAADRTAAEEARQSATLQDYLGQMSGLMLHEKLLSSKASDPVRAVARTVTLATLRRLDAERKGQVVRFLYEARLVDRELPRVSLDDADLRGAIIGAADLRDADLEGADLARANLTDADLKGANLAGANLARAELAHADLSGAQVGDAELAGANLRGTNLARAELAGASLRGANLAWTELSDALLFGADLVRAQLAHANLAGANLGAADLGGADLDGAGLGGADLDAATLRGAELGGAILDGAENLDLGKFITDLRPNRRKEFLDSQKEFFDSLPPDGLAKFNLSPEKLKKLRQEASGG